MAKPDIWWPLKGKVTVTGKWGNSPDFYQQFGQKGHNGIDLKAPLNTPVYAADDGAIRAEGWGRDNSWMGSIAGIYVLITHKTMITGYAHLTRTVVDAGQRVKRGQLIGYSGQTGVGTGPHLHFETLPLKPNFGNGYAGRVNPASIATIHQYGWKAPRTRTLIKRMKPRRETVYAEATRNSKVIDTLNPRALKTVSGWQHGQKTGSSDIWLRVKSKGKYGWVHSSGFANMTSNTTKHLKDFN